MSIERTLILIKPDGVERGLVGEVLSRIERKGFTLVALELRTLDVETARAHYGEHEGKPFFGELVDFMVSAPVVVQVLEGENAVARYREIMGATNPAQAAEGTIRKLYAVSVGENSVHGSDSVENAGIEIAQFFSQNEILPA